MDELEFREKFEKEKHIYEAWANYSKNYILEKFSEEVDLDLFLKADSPPRIYTDSGFSLPD